MATAVPTVEPARRRGRLRLPERLPNLKGAWLTVYSIVWGIILPLSLIGAAIGVHISFTTPSMWTGYGFATNEDSHGLHVDSVISAPARATGLKAGDYVVAIDGWAVPQKAARAEARSHVIKPDGSWTNFTIRDPRGRTFDIRLPRSMAFERQRFKEAGVSFPVARILAIAGSLLVPALFIPAAVLLFFETSKRGCSCLPVTRLPSLRRNREQRRYAWDRGTGRQPRW